MQLLDEMSPKDLCRLLHALREQCCHHQPFLSAVAQRLAGQPLLLQRFNEGQLAEIVDTFNKLNYTGSEVAAIARHLQSITAHMESGEDDEDTPTANVPYKPTALPRRRLPNPAVVAAGGGQQQHGPYSRVAMAACSKPCGNCHPVRPY